jgi:hypothetical protein
MATTHRGYIAGRYRDGALSDGWTDITRCAEGTFIAYVARCGCGWLGQAHPASSGGYRTAQRELTHEHLVGICGYSCQLIFTTHRDQDSAT